MADRILFIGWGAVARGSEERALEVFNESLGILGRRQQDGLIEAFDVQLLEPNSDLAGYVEVRGSAEQLAALRSDPEFRRTTADSMMVVDNIRHIGGYTDAGVAEQMELYQQAIARVPQRA